MHASIHLPLQAEWSFDSLHNAVGLHVSRSRARSLGGSFGAAIFTALALLLVHFAGSLAWAAMTLSMQLMASTSSALMLFLVYLWVTPIHRSRLLTLRWI